MKKVKFFLFVMTFLLFNTNIFSQTIKNIAYLKSQNIEKASNEVLVELKKNEVQFKEHAVNLREQYLDEENQIYVIGELDLTEAGNSKVYFKKNMYSSFYPENIRFFLQEEGDLEYKQIEKENVNTTKEIELEGGKKYKIISVGNDIKNTPNILSGNFSLEAFYNAESIGEVVNKLIIKNEIMFKANIENKEVQNLDFKNQIETIADIKFENILNENIRFKFETNKSLSVDSVVGKIGEKTIRFYWNDQDQCFYSEDVEFQGEGILKVLGAGIHVKDEVKSADFVLSLLVNNKEYGNITNNLITESKNKILLEKKSSQSIARVGDLLKYEITAKVVNEDSFKKIVFKDTLPRGFEFIEKSLKISQGKIENIRVLQKNTVIFDINFFEKELRERELKIEYLVRINITSKLGKNTNRAIVYGDNGINSMIFSNEASATVEVDGDNFSEKGIVLGLIYLDLDGDNTYNIKKDIGVPGVQVFLENGDFAITDEDGKYSIYGEDAVTHIAKIKKDSLPIGLRGVKLTNLHAKNGMSQFIDLKKSQLSRGDFAFSIDKNKEKEEVLNEIENRKKIFKEIKNELTYELDNNELEFKKNTKFEKKELGERGTINNHQMIDFNKGVLNVGNTQETEEKIETEEIDIRKKMKILNEEELSGKIEELENTLDIINIEDGDVGLKYMTFQIKSPLDGKVELFVNDKKIGLEHIGIKASSALNSLLFLEYVAVELNEGKNKIRAEYYDQFGIERNKIEKEILVRGDLSKIKFNIEKYLDESGIVKFKLEGTDNNDIPVEHNLNARVTLLDEKKGEWIAGDDTKNPKEIQVSIPKNGSKNLFFKPKSGKNKVKFKVQIEDIEEEFVFEMEGKTQPIFVNGIFEGRVNLKGKASDEFFFQKNLSSILNDKLSYRGAVFTEGHIKNNYFLTMTYDNVKEDEKFFSYKDPDDYYPIYGDNSIKGHTGESRNDLYIKLEKEESYVMYGDVKTSELFDDRFRLNQYSRTLTGFSSKVIKENVEINTFFSKTSSSKVIEEIQGEGISGPYNISNRNILEGSEEISLVVYQRGSKIILSELLLSNGTDYTIDYDLGRIYFSQPIMSMDLQFNPIFIKINYEIEEESGKKNPVYGIVGEYKINENLSVGSSYVKNDDEIEAYEMKGVAIIYENENNLIITEASKTDDFEEGSGKGQSVYYKFENESGEIKARYEKTDANYYNPDAKVQSGVDNIEVEAEYKLKSKNLLKFKSEILKQNSDSSYNKRDIYLGVELEKTSDFIYEIGAKHYFKSDDLDQGEVNTLGIKVIWEPENYKDVISFIEYEQDILLTDKKRVAAGIDYLMNDETTLYFRQEIISELSDEYYLDPEDDSNRTLVGVKSKQYFGSEIFTEYREVNEENGVIPEVGTGLKKEIEITENLMLSGTFERTDPVTNNNAENEENKKSENALTFSYDYKIDSSSKTRGDFEWKFGQTSSFLNKLGYGKKMTESLYFIAKNRYFTEEQLEKENRLVLGFAYRDIEENKYNSLNKYELNYSKNIIDENYKQVTNLLRSSHNYKFTPELEGTLTLALKNIDTVYEGINSNYTAYLIASTLSYNIYENWTTGISVANVLDNMKNTEYGLGAEVGYNFESNLWLSLGYNFIGFKDKDFDPSGDLNKGVFLRFRMNIGDMFNR